MKPTPYTEVNEVLDLLLSRIRPILGPKLKGFYLYGSLATGDFDPESSDIDFVAAIEEGLSRREFRDLKRVHREIYEQRGKWNQKLEGAYLPPAALRRYDANSRQAFVNGDEPLRLTKLGPDWIINFHVLREKGATLYGPNPRNLIDPISKKETIQAVRDELLVSWKPLLRNPKKMRSRLYQSFAVLTMCRALYTLKFGQIISKVKAAKWAQENLDPRWTSLIRPALNQRDDRKFDRSGLKETIQFVGWVIDNFYPEKT